MPIAASLLLGSLALLIIGVQPILLGALIDAHRLTLDEVGVLAMCEIVTLGLGVVLGDALPLRRFRLVIVVAALLCAMLDLATPVGRGPADWLVLRGLAGLAEGVLVWATTGMIVRSATPERLAGLFMAVQSVLQAAMAALLAGVVLPRGDWPAGFVALGLAAAIAAPLAATQPSHLRPLPAAPRGEGSAWSACKVLALAIVFVQQAGIGALWAFLEPLGQAAGLDAQAAQAAISLVLVMQLLGTGAGTLLVRRLDSVSAAGTGALVLAAIGVALCRLPMGQHAAFTGLTALFGFAWMFLFPFQIGLAFRADGTGRVASLVPAMQLLGCAFGPLVASLTVQGDQARPIAAISAGFSATAALLLWTARRPLRHPNRPPQDGRVGSIRRSPMP